MVCCTQSVWEYSAAASSLPYTQSIHYVQHQREFRCDMQSSCRDSMLPLNVVVVCTMLAGCSVHAVLIGALRHGVKVPFCCDVLWGNCMEEAACYVSLRASPAGQEATSAILSCCTASLHCGQGMLAVQQRELTVPHDCSVAWCYPKNQQNRPKSPALWLQGDDKASDHFFVWDSACCGALTKKGPM